MAVLRAVEATQTDPRDPIVARLDLLLADFGAAVDEAAAAAPGRVDDATRIDRIARLEKLRAATAAWQAAETVRFAQSQVQEQMAQDVDPKQIGRGIADQIALACHLSPFGGTRRLHTARALWFDLPGTYAALTVGAVSEHVAELVVSETRHLDGEQRRRVDAQVVAAGITEMGVRAAAACARKLAYQADPQAYLDRGRTERKHRRVGLRPRPDTMASLTGYLPAEQAVACYAALRRHTDAHVAVGDKRSRDQIMADTMIELLTGQIEAGDINVEVQLTMPLDSLIDPAKPGITTLAGYGPLPGELARDLITTSRGRKWWRRLFTAPPSCPTGIGPVIGGDAVRRRFDGWLAKLIEVRDQHCRDPYCNAPIRHLDHIHRFRDGGPTTLANGRGTCVRGNLVREMPGWQVTLIDAGQRTRPHEVLITTPTGHTYRSRAPDPP